MKNQYDYTNYKCPYEHLEKECGHELKGPEGYETNSVWCACGFNGPVLYLDPKELKLEPKVSDITTYTIGITDTQTITIGIDTNNIMVSAELEGVDIMPLIERYGIGEFVQRDYGRREG